MSTEHGKSPFLIMPNKKTYHEFQCGPDYKGVAELDAGHDVTALTFEPTPELEDIRFSTDIKVREKDTMEDVFVRYVNYLYLGNASVWDALYESLPLNDEGDGYDI